MAQTYDIRPLFDPTSCTWSYILYDIATKKAALIDSVAEQIDRDLKLISDMGLNLEYLIETHIHADHVTAAGPIKDKTGAKIIFGAGAKAVIGADFLMKDGEEITLGNTKIKVLETSGHTNSCTSYAVDGAVFTGDTLFIRGCGRTDFQDGSTQSLFNNVRNKLFTLPDETRVYPGHDYKGMSFSTIGEEKQFNPRLKMSNSESDFTNIMNGLNLPRPKLMDMAVPKNLKVGR